MRVNRRIGLSALLWLLLLVFAPATAGASPLPDSDEESGGGGVSYPCWETAWAEPGDPGDPDDGSGGGSVGDPGEGGSPEGSGEVKDEPGEPIMVCYAPGTPVEDGDGTATDGGGTDTGGGGWAGGGGDGGEPTSGPDESGGPGSESGSGDVEGENDSLDPDSAEAHEEEADGCEGGGGDSGGVMPPDMPIDSGPADVGGDPDEPVSSSALAAVPPCAEVTSVANGGAVAGDDGSLLGALPTRIDAGAGALAATGAPAAGLLAGAAALLLAAGSALRRRRRR